MKTLSFILVIIFLSTAAYPQGNGLTKEQIKKIVKITAPVRAKVEKALKKENSKLYADYQKDLKAMAKLKTEADLRKAHNAFTFKYQAFVMKAYTAANIDEAYYKKAITDYLRSIPGQLGFDFGDYLSIFGTDSRDDAPPEGSGNTCDEFHCPLDVTNTSTSANGIGGGLGVVSDCSAYSMTMGTIAVGVEQFSALGEEVRIRPDKKVNISSKFDFDIFGAAYAVVGGGYCEASVGILIEGPDLNRRVEKISNWTLAPVIWYSEFQDTGTNQRIEVSLDSRNGGIHKVQVYAQSYVLTAFRSGSLSTSKSEKIDFIQVCQVAK